MSNPSFDTVTTLGSSLIQTTLSFVFLTESFLVLLTLSDTLLGLTIGNLAVTATLYLTILLFSKTVAVITAESLPFIVTVPSSSTDATVGLLLTYDVTISAYDTMGRYNVSGDESNKDVTVADEIIHIYPIMTNGEIILPDAIRGNDKFLGWFTKEQPEKGGSGDGGVFVGYPGDSVEVIGDVTFYPWFNIAPTIAHSAISDGFYEGQPISYEQLLSIIDSKDVDDFTDGAIDNIIKYNGTRNWIDLYGLNASVWLDYNYPNMSYEDKQEILSSINYDDFKPSIEEIIYYCDVDSSGQPKAAACEKQEGSNVKTYGLITNNSHLGKCEIVYSITDNGTVADGTFDKNNVLADSPIKVYYKMHVDIIFNNPPTVKLKPCYVFTYDNGITSSNVEDYLIKSQSIFDIQDDKSNRPWWYAEDVDFNAPADNTHNNLVDTLHIVGIYDIEFQSAYEIEHVNECNDVKAITDIKELFKLKDRGLDIFNYITSFKVEVDGVDQWGKMASDGYDVNGNKKVPKPMGMSREERSFEVIMFNNSNDFDLVYSTDGDKLRSIDGRMRYIDILNLDTLKENTYWGDDEYGLNTLKDTLKRYEDKHSNNDLNESKDEGNKDSTGTLKNPTAVDNNHTIDITVNDYTK